MTVIKKYLTNAYHYIAKQTAEAGQQVTLFAMVMMINYPLFGLIWKIEKILSPEEYVLRLSATALCILLVLSRIWPSQFKNIVPILWYVTLLVCLPFFFSYLTFVHQGSTIWLMNCVSAVFLLLLVTRVFDALVLIFLGFGLAVLLYFSISGQTIVYVPGEVSVFGLASTFFAAITIGALFARDREIIQASRISGMRLLAGSLAHDLRTSLASIHLQAELQEAIVEKLSKSNVQKDLKISLNKIVRGIEMGNQLISMQLNNIQQEKFDTSQFMIQPMASLLQCTLDEYPLKEEQKKLIVSNLINDFPVWIDKVAFKNLIWNLLKNSLDYVEETGKGTISIWMNRGIDGDDFNYLNIKDTAKGIYPKNVEKIFDSFYSDRKGGTGVGLAYCKLLMRAAGGDIYCKGKFNTYAHFILKFPKID